MEEKQIIPQIADELGSWYTGLTGANTAIRRQVYDAQKAGISPSLLFDKGASGANTTSAGIDGTNKMLSNVIQALVNQNRTNAMVEMNEDRLQTQKDINKDRLQTQRDINLDKNMTSTANTIERNKAYNARTEAQFDSNMLQKMRRTTSYYNFYGYSPTTGDRKG